MKSNNNKSNRHSIVMKGKSNRRLIITIRTSNRRSIIPKERKYSDLDEMFENKEESQ